MGYSPEYAALEGDPAYLSHLAELGGGTALEEPAGAFAHTLRGEGSTRDLWPYLLGLATLLLPFDVGVRRLALGRRDLEKAQAWVLERLPRRRPRPVAEAPSAVSRLFEAKSRAEGGLPQSGRRPATGAPASEIPSPPPAGRTSVPPFRPVKRPTEPPSAPPAVEGETLAGQLLRRKRERREDE